MLFSRSFLRRSLLWLLCLGGAACGAQGTQFQSVPQVEFTGGRVTSFTTGIFQAQSSQLDILYTNSLSGGSAIQVGELLNQGGPGFAALASNSITFTGASQVAAATGNFLGGLTYAFAISGHTPNLCLYAGTLAQAPTIGKPSPGSSYSGGNAFPPTGGNSGCTTIAPPLNGASPRFDYAYELPARTGTSQLVLVDGANSLVDIVSFSGASTSGGVLFGAVVTASIAVPAPDGTGPVYVGDFNHDGNPDFIVNGQAGATATEYFGDGAGHVGTGVGSIPAPIRYLFSGVRSMLLEDMDHDGNLDMVVENNLGGIEIHLGDAITGLFSNAVAGGTASSPGSEAGNGGRLAAINPNTMDILTTTPVGLSLLSAPGGTLNYALKAIYDIGPGRTSFALADFYASGSLDLAADSTEGVAIVRGNPDGTFQATLAYPALTTAAAEPLGRSSINSQNANGAGASETHARSAALATTNTTLALCVGPSAACPSTGSITPPIVPLLTMIYGQTYNGTASVVASDGSALAGNTVFYDSYNGGAPTQICILPTSTGGTCPASVGTGTTVGTHVFTAAYLPGSADTTHTASTSPTVTIVVTQDSALATASGSPNPSPAGLPVTLNGTITGVNAPAPLNVGSYVPATGSITFTYNGSVLGSAPLVAAAGGASSTASLTTSVLPVGNDVVTATYSGDGNITGASANFTEVITPSLAGAFTITATPSPVSVGVGYSALLIVTVTATNGFSQAVNLSCSNLPPEASCFFDSATIAAGGGTTSLVVATSSPHNCGTNQPYFLGSNGGGSGLLPVALPALAGLLAVFLPRRKRLRGRWLRGLLVVAVAALAMQATGCGGNCTDLGTRPATYTFQVNGTAATTGAVVSQPVTITVAI